MWKRCGSGAVAVTAMIEYIDNIHDLTNNGVNRSMERFKNPHRRRIAAAPHEKNQACVFSVFPIFGVTAATSVPRCTADMDSFLDSIQSTDAVLHQHKCQAV